MGSDVYAYACIGVRVPSSRLVKRVPVPGCKCGKAAEGAKFCPQCGKPALVGEDVPIPEYDQDNKLLAGWDLCSDGYETHVFVGRLANTNSGLAGKKVPLRPAEVEEIKTALQVSLEPLGLWDAQEFGLWAILYCSY